MQLNMLKLTHFLVDTEENWSTSFCVLEVGLVATEAFSKSIGMSEKKTTNHEEK